MRCLCLLGALCLLAGCRPSGPLSARPGSGPNPDTLRARYSTEPATAFRYVSAAAFSPKNDLLVTGYCISDPEGHYFDESKLLTVWDVATGKPLRTLAGGWGSVQFVAFLPDGRQVLSADHLGVVKVWDVDSGREVRHFTVYKHGLACAALSPDGKRLLCWGLDGDIPHLKLVDVGSGQPIKVYGSFQGHVRRISLSKSGHEALLACDPFVAGTGHDDGGLKLLDLGTGDTVHTFPNAPGRWIGPAALSPNGQVAIGGQDKSNPLRYSLVMLHTPDGHTMRILPVPSAAVVFRFAPDGERLFSAHRGGVLREWDIARGEQTWSANVGGALAFSPDATLVLAGRTGDTRGDPRGTASMDLHLWDLREHKELRTLAVLPDR